MYAWLKLYYEILDDPKMGVLPDRLWRRTIELFLCAGKLGGDKPEGKLPSTEHIAWMIRVNPEELQKDLEELQARTNIIEPLPNGGWLVKKFSKRQAATPTRERVRQYRERQEKAGQEPLPEISNITRLYEENFGVITPFIRDMLVQCESDYPQDWITRAIEKAIKNNAHKWSYVEAILRDWQVNGFDNHKKNTKPPDKAKPKSYAERELDGAE